MKKAKEDRFLWLNDFADDLLDHARYAKTTYGISDAQYERMIAAAEPLLAQMRNMLPNSVDKFPWISDLGRHAASVPAVAAILEEATRLENLGIKRIQDKIDKSVLREEKKSEKIEKERKEIDTKRDVLLEQERTQEETLRNLRHEQSRDHTPVISWANGRYAGELLQQFLEKTESQKRLAPFLHSLAGISGKSWHGVLSELVVSQDESTNTVTVTFEYGSGTNRTSYMVAASPDVTTITSGQWKVDDRNNKITRASVQLPADYHPGMEVTGAITLSDNERLSVSYVCHQVKDQASLCLDDEENAGRYPKYFMHVPCLTGTLSESDKQMLLELKQLADETDPNTLTGRVFEMVDKSGR